MKQYEIIHKGKKYVTMSIDGLMKTLIDFCTEENLNPNEIESCVLIPEKEYKPIKGLKKVVFDTLVVDRQYENENRVNISISIIYDDEKGKNNANKFISKLIQKQQSLY